MSSAYTLKISSEEAKEMPMVDLAFNILKAANTPFYYRDLMDEIAKIKGISEEEKMDVIAHLYTEINIDGRFACVGTNLWGLKRWYPVEKSDDTIGSGERPRIINDDDDEDEDDPFELEIDDEFSDEEDDEDIEDDEYDDDDEADDEDDDIEEDIDEIDDLDEEEEDGDLDLVEPLLDEEEEDLDLDD